MARVRGYKYLITKDWDSGSIGYRALRITTMIKNHKGLHDVDSMVRFVAGYAQQHTCPCSWMYGHAEEHSARLLLAASR